MIGVEPLDATPVLPRPSTSTAARRRPGPNIKVSLDSLAKNYSNLDAVIKHEDLKQNLQIIASNGNS